MRSCYIFLVDSLRIHLPINSLFIKHATAIDPMNKFNKSTSKSLTYLADKIGNSLKNTIKCPLQEFIDKVHTEFQLYVTDNDLPTNIGRLDEYWWAVLDRNKGYVNLCKLAFHVMVIGYCSNQC